MTDNRTTELLPCPICGGQPDFQHFNITPNVQGRIICACGIELRQGKNDTEDDMRIIWNTRSDYAVQAENEHKAEQAIAATLGSERIAELEAENERLRKAGYEIGYHDAMKAAKRGGTLTADDVLNAVYNHGARWQAIADELNAELGSGTCEQEERGWGTEGDHARVWLTCGHDCMVPTVADLPNYCPECGAKVVSA